MSDRVLMPGTIVQHFKRAFEDKDSTKYLYEVVDTCTHSETLEKMVLYRQMYSPYGLFVRPYDMFMSEVDGEKYPYVKQRYRFEEIDSETERERLIAIYKEQRGL